MQKNQNEIDQIKEYKCKMANRFRKLKQTEESNKEELKMAMTEKFLPIKDDSIIIQPEHNSFSEKGWVSEVKFFDLSKGSENDIKLKSKNIDLKFKIIQNPFMTPELIHSIEILIDTNVSIQNNNMQGRSEERKEALLAENKIELEADDLDLHVL